MSFLVFIIETKPHNYANDITISVIAIIMFAPTGSILMDLTANKLLQSTN